MSLERSFKGVFIPLSFWERKDLFWNDKVFLIEADSRYEIGEKFWAYDIVETLDFNERNSNIVTRSGRLGFIQENSDGTVELLKPLK